MADPSAETAPTVPPDPATAQLLRERDQAQARQAIAEANAATVKAALPALPDAQSAPPAGVSFADSGGTTLAAVVAGRQLTKVVHKVLGRLESDLPSRFAPMDSQEPVRDRIVLVGDLSIANTDIALTTVRNAFEQLTNLVHQFDDFNEIPQPVPAEATPEGSPDTLAGFGLDEAQTLLGALPTAAAVAAATAGVAVSSPVGVALAVGAAALPLAVNLVSLFRTTYTVSNRAVSISALALEAEVAGQLTKNGYEVVLPGFALVRDSSVFQSLNELVGLRHDLALRVAYAKASHIDPVSQRIAGLSAEVTQLLPEYAKTVGPKPSEATLIAAKIAELRSQMTTAASATYRAAAARIDAATSVIAAVDGFIQTATTVPTGQSLAPIVAAALQEQLHSTTSASRLYLLHVEVVSSGGELVTPESLRGGSKIGLLGGVQVAYLASDARGLILGGGLESELGSDFYDVGKPAWLPQR